MSLQLNKILKEICLEDGIEISGFAGDYVLCLTRQGKKMYIYGNKFGNNSSSSELLCDDKAALSQVLSENNIPCVNHEFFPSPGAWWSDEEKSSQTKRLHRMFSENPKGLVIKDNKGSGGRNVFRTENEEAAEDILEKIFSQSDSAAVCPYESILHEYRVLMLGREFIYAFEKIRSPEQGEWRHNLGQGATPLLVTASELTEKLCSLARKSMEVLNLDFASVDIIQSDGKLKILEINSGVMIDAFSAYSPQYYALAKEGIRKAIRRFFGI